MKLLVDGKLIKVTAKNDGSTLEYFAYCWEQSLQQSVTNRDREFSSDQFNKFFLELIDKRDDTKTLVNNIFKKYDKELMLYTMLLSIEKLDMSPWLASVNGEDETLPNKSSISILAAKQAFFPSVKPDNRAKITSLTYDIIKALNVREGLSWIQRMYNEHAATGYTLLDFMMQEYEPVSTSLNVEAEYTLGMGKQLRQILQMSTLDGAHLTDNQISTLLANNPDFYLPDILNTFFDLIVKDTTTRTSDENRIQIICSSATLRKHSTPENAQTVLDQVDRYLKNDKHHHAAMVTNIDGASLRRSSR